MDTLFDKHCICKRGWNGTFCEQEVNECLQKPCQNGATCRDQVIIKIRIFLEHRILIFKNQNFW